MAPILQTHLTPLPLPPPCPLCSGHMEVFSIVPSLSISMPVYMLSLCLENFSSSSRSRSQVPFSIKFHLTHPPPGWIHILALGCLVVSISLPWKIIICVHVCLLGHRFYSSACPQHPAQSWHVNASINTYWNKQSPQTPRFDVWSRLRAEGWADFMWQLLFQLLERECKSIVRRSDSLTLELH